MSLDLETKKVERVAGEQSEGIYVDPGYLVFVREGTLTAQPLDLKSLRPRGESVPIAEGVQFNPYRWTGNYAVSATGLLLYRSGPMNSKRRLAWFDLEGNPLGPVGESAQFDTVRIAPDGKRAVAAIRDDRSALSLWIYDLERGVPTRLTFGPEPAVEPVWSPDGREILYADGTGSIFRKASDGAAEATLLLSLKGHPIWARDWSSDGSAVSFNSQSSKTANDIEILTLPGGREPHRFLAGEADERGGFFSPDGKWLAYTSNESGRTELYVVPFPGPGGKRQISAGGCAPDFAAWINGGRELAYATPERKLNAVEMTLQGAALLVGRERSLFGGKALPGLGEFTRDAQRMLLPVPTGEDTAPALTLVSDWIADLNRP
jgi:hypothetical protein